MPSNPPLSPALKVKKRQQPSHSEPKKTNCQPPQLWSLISPGLAKIRTIHSSVHKHSTPGSGPLHPYLPVPPLTNNLRPAGVILVPWRSMYMASKGPLYELYGDTRLHICTTSPLHILSFEPDMPPKSPDMGSERKPQLAGRSLHAAQTAPRGIHDEAAGSPLPSAKLRWPAPAAGVYGKCIWHKLKQPQTTQGCSLCNPPNGRTSGSHSGFILL